MADRLFQAPAAAGVDRGSPSPPSSAAGRPRCIWRARWHRRCRCSRYGGLAARCWGSGVRCSPCWRRKACVYFTFFTPEFNHNVVLLPLWAALGLAGYRAFFEPRQLACLCRRWAWFGVLAALGHAGQVHHRAVAAVIAGAGDRASRPAPRMDRPGPWLALAVALLLLLPHLVGSVADRLCAAVFPVRARAGPGHWYNHIVNPLLFAVAQFGDIAAALLALALLAWRRPGEQQAMPDSQHHCRRSSAPICATITWAPAALAVAASLILGLHLKDMWGYPMWCFIGLFLMAEDGRSHYDRRAAAILRSRGWSFWSPCRSCSLCSRRSADAFCAKATRAQFPGRELGARGGATLARGCWRAPLAIVAGDVWIAGNIAFYGGAAIRVHRCRPSQESRGSRPAALAQAGCGADLAGAVRPARLAEQVSGGAAAAADRTALCAAARASAGPASHGRSVVPHNDEGLLAAWSCCDIMTLTRWLNQAVVACIDSRGNAT